MHIAPWDKAASPVRDRFLSIKNADSEDSDAGGEDLSEETDHSDDLENELDENEAELSGEESADPYKKRFADTKADRDRLKKERDDLAAEKESLRLENERLRTQGQAHHTDTGKSEIDRVHETETVMEIADAVNREYLSLPDDKRNVKSMTEAIARNLLKKMDERAAAISRQEATRVVSTVDGKKVARQMADEALAAAGLDAGKHFPILRTIINQRMDSDPAWFQRTGHDLKSQYKTLAQETKDYLVSIGATLSKEQVRKANDELLREAGGDIGGGKRRATDTPRQTPDDDDTAQSGTMIAAMAGNRRQLFARAAKAAGRR